jgi:signal transduction histidine kinase
VTLGIATREDGEAARPDVAFVHVRDTGVGIAPGQQERIFEPFVQVRVPMRSAYAREAEGTGLGLAISRDLARGMGGDLRVRSTPGEGSAFTVTLRRVLDADGHAVDRRARDARQDERRDARRDAAPG